VKIYRNPCMQIIFYEVSVTFFMNLSLGYKI